MGKKKTAEMFRSRIVGEGELRPSELLDNPKNWRKHPKAQLDALQGLLSEVGWVQRVIVNRETGHIVDGHARVELARTRKEPTVPVLYVALSPEEEALVLAALDPIGGMAETDQDALDAILEGVTATDAGLQSLLDGLRSETDAVESAPSEPPPGIDYQEKFAVLVDCKDEADQERIFAALTAQGFTCKVLVN